MLSGKTDPGYAPAAAGRCQSILYSVSGCDSVIGKKGHTGKSVAAALMLLQQLGASDDD